MQVVKQVFRSLDGNKKLDTTQGGWQTVAPSAIGYHDNEATPLAMDSEAIQKVITDFKTTKRSRQVIK
jgi:2,4-dienoyl-CoA reductase-like NADH-dependent reductase (Old Yellow Enzyme family)